jgi:hypothetical protein
MTQADSVHSTPRRTASKTLRIVAGTTAPPLDPAEDFFQAARSGLARHQRAPTSGQDLNRSGARRVCIRGARHQGCAGATERNHEGSNRRRFCGRRGACENRTDNHARGGRASEIRLNDLLTRTASNPAPCRKPSMGKRGRSRCSAPSRQRSRRCSHDRYKISLTTLAAVSIPAGREGRKTALPRSGRPRPRPRQSRSLRLCLKSRGGPPRPTR